MTPVKRLNERTGDALTKYVVKDMKRNATLFGEIGKADNEEPAKLAKRLISKFPKTRDAVVRRVAAILTALATAHDINLIFRFKNKGKTCVPPEEGHSDKPDGWAGDEVDEWPGWVWLRTVFKINEVLRSHENRETIVDDDAIVQAFRYCELLRYHQPHVHEHLVLLASREGYRVCIRGLEFRLVTPLRKWIDLKLLLWFLKRITSQDFRDTRLDVVRGSGTGKLKKDKKIRAIFDLKVDNRLIHILPLGCSMSARKSFVGTGKECTKQPTPSKPIGPVIVKIQNKDAGRKASEKRIILKLSGVPGVVRLAELDIMDVSFSEPGSQHLRTCHLLSTIGRPLSTCTSFLRFFEVIFDLVETHRQMLQLHVLHRDPSWGNVMVLPAKDTAGKILNNSDWFIANLLNTTDTTEPRYANGLWTDFDCSLETIRGDTLPTTSEAAMGTRMFMAEDLLHPFSRLLRDLFTGRVDISISSKLDDNVFGNLDERTQTQADFCEKLDKTSQSYTANLASYNHIASRIEATNNNNQPATSHQNGATDMESLFWILVVYILRARVKGALVSEEMRYFSSHIFQAVQSRASRAIFGELLTWTQRMEGVHQHGRLLPMLRKLAIYFSVPWFAADSASNSNEFHAHDTFQALLLPIIMDLRQNGDMLVDADNPIPLVGLPTFANSTTSPFHTTGRRRTAEQAGFAYSESETMKKMKLKADSMTVKWAEMLGFEEIKEEIDERGRDARTGLENDNGTHPNPQPSSSDDEEIVQHSVKEIMVHDCGCTLDCSLGRDIYNSKKYIL